MDAAFDRAQAAYDAAEPDWYDARPAPAARNRPTTVLTALDVAERADVVALLDELVGEIEATS